MDRELEEQIDDIIHKATKDLKTRIARIVVRHQTKLLKEQARELKSGASTNTRKTNTSSDNGRKQQSKVSSRNNSKKDSKYSDSDSDGYYSN